MDRTELAVRLIALNLIAYCRQIACCYGIMDNIPLRRAGIKIKINDYILLQSNEGSPKQSGGRICGIPE